MAELLVLLRTPDGPDKAGKPRAGDPIEIRDDGFPWADFPGLGLDPATRAAPYRFGVLAFPGLTREQLQNAVPDTRYGRLVESDTEVDPIAPLPTDPLRPPIKRLRRFRVWRFALANLPAALRVKLRDTGRLVMGQDFMANQVRNVLERRAARLRRDD